MPLSKCTRLVLFVFGTGRSLVLWSCLISFMFLIGCGTLDLTKEHTGPAPICDIHKCEMHPERISVGGEIVYMGNYWEICRTQFPHHGGNRYHGETEKTPYGRNVIDYVCPECDKAYHLYWKNTQKVNTEKEK